MTEHVRYPAPSVRLMLVRDASSSTRRHTYVRSSTDAYAAVRPVLESLAQERFVALLLDQRSKLLSVATVAEGGFSECPVDPKAIFAAALLSGATALILAHNHPSGDPTPSAPDLALTRRLVDGGTLLCIRVLDHIVIGNDNFVSLRETQAK